MKTAVYHEVVVALVPALAAARETKAARAKGKKNDAIPKVQRTCCESFGIEPTNLSLARSRLGLEPKLCARSLHKTHGGAETWEATGFIRRPDA